MTPNNKLDELRKKSKKTKKSSHHYQSSKKQRSHRNPQQGSNSQSSDKHAQNFLEFEQKIAQLETELHVIKSESEDWKAKAQRISADLQNVNRQHELDIQQVKKQSKKYIVLSLSDFLNTMNLSFSFIPHSDDEKVNKFMQTLKTSFESVIHDLSQQGVEVISPKPGDPFDAVTMSALNEGTDSTNIAHVVTLGIKIDNQVVKPATVMLG